MLNKKFRQLSLIYVWGAKKSNMKTLGGPRLIKTINCQAAIKQIDATIDQKIQLFNPGIWNQRMGV